MLKEFWEKYVAGPIQLERGLLDREPDFLQPYYLRNLSRNLLTRAKQSTTLNPRCPSGFRAGAAREVPRTAVRLGYAMVRSAEVYGVNEVLRQVFRPR